MRRLLVPLLALVACAPPVSTTSGPARRVLSQTVLSDEILWTLGPDARARVVGLSVMADDPRYSRVVDLWPPEIPRLAVTSEGLLARDPDLVVIASFTAPEVKALLTAQRVRLLEFDSFTGFADYRAHLRALATAVEAAPAGERAVAELDARLAALAATRPAVALTAVAWGDGYAATGGTTFADVAAAAGLINLPEQAGLSGHVPVAIEQLVAWDPQIIVVSCPATAPDDPACAAAEASFAAGPGISATQAAQGRGVVAIPARDLGSTGEGMLVTAELLQARVLARP
ncbi:MAG TPA: ABC transporter substrate-binding protein [Nannocystis sp.]|jgi:iron complex transport system substrate-binding protein